MFGGLWPAVRGHPELMWVIEGVELQNKVAERSCTFPLMNTNAGPPAGQHTSTSLLQLITFIL